MSFLQDPNALRLGAFFGALGVMLACESLWPKRRWETSRVKRLGAHLGVSLFNTLLTRFLVVLPLLLWLQFVEEKGWGLARFFGLGGVAEAAATFVVFDAFDYGWHRLNHRWPLLWRFHRAHHMDTHVDVTTALRFHTGELIFSGIAKFFWILFWGPSAAAFIIAEAAVTAFSEFHHSNIDFPDRIQKVLREFIMTPRVHTSHHTVTIRTRDANYATIFSVWDRLFGSFREPDWSEMRLLGLEEGRQNYLSIPAFLKAPFLALAFILLLNVPAFAEMTAQSSGERREFELTYQGEIFLPEDAKKTEVWIPLAGSREGQKILERNITLPVPYKILMEPVYGNEMIHFKTNYTAGPLPFRIHYHAVVDEAYFEEAAVPEDASLYLKSTSLMRVDGKVKEIARSIVPPKGSFLDKARAIYDYVITHMQYDKTTPGWGRGDTERACVIGKGNCTDFHSLFISVAHAAEIPARFKIGFQIPDAAEGSIAGYHCWAEFLEHRAGGERDSGRFWKPVDASEAWKNPGKRDDYFARFDPNKFLISMGRDIELAPRQKGGPVNIFFYPYVEADGKAVEGAFKTEFYYKEKAVQPRGGQ